MKNWLLILGCLGFALTACDVEEEDGGVGDGGGGAGGGTDDGGVAGEGGGGGGGGGAAVTGVDATWTGGGVGDEGGDVTFVITGGSASGYELGMAETGSGDTGWYGEACGGSEDSICHQLGATGGTLDHVTMIDLVEPGSTLFANEIKGNITYFLRSMDSPEECYVWGENVAYYSAESCSEL